jgi:hypothetical protein
MPTIRKMSPEKRKALTEKFIDELEADPTPENDRRLAIYRYIDSVSRSTRDQRFAFLACQRLLVVRKCPFEHYRRFMRPMFCRQRFYCVPCADWRMKRQVDKWEDAIKAAIRLTTLHLGPAVELSWEIPDVKDRAGLNRFNEYLKQTWQMKLSRQGIDPGDWMLMSVYDPIRAQIRALYLGPPLDFRLLRNNSGSKKSVHYPSSFNIKPPAIETTRVVNAKRRKRGNFSPWKPKRVRSTYLLDVIPEPPDVAAGLFFRRIRSGLEWVAGNIVDILELDPARACQLDHLYSRRRLSATRGVIYAQERAASDSNKVDDDPILIVHRKAIDGHVELVEVDPTELIGALNEQQGSCLPGDPPPQLCPDCGTALVDSYEDGDPPKQVAIQ